MREVAATEVVDGMQEGRTVNLVSTDSRQVQGRTVAPALHSPSLYPVRPAIATPFPRTAVKPLERATYPSRVARFYEGWMDEWCEEPATHSCLHTPPFCYPPSLARLSRGGGSLQLLAFRKTSK